jgi:hypothetical protein
VGCQLQAGFDALVEFVGPCRAVERAMTMFYKSRPDADGKYSEYWLEDAATGSVIRKDYKLVSHSSGLQPMPDKSEMIESFLIRDVDPTAKKALAEFLDKAGNKK